MFILMDRHLSLLTVHTRVHPHLKELELMGSLWLRPLACRFLSSATRSGRRRKSRSNLSLEALESRTLLSGVRSYDGSGNNLANPSWGQAGTALLRAEHSVHYADSISSPACVSKGLARCLCGFNSSINLQLHSWIVGANADVIRGGRIGAAGRPLGLR